MKRQIKLVVSDTTKMTERIIGYFSHFDYALMSNRDGTLKFKRRSTLLDAWKSNPLKWGSEISISISNTDVLADFFVDTNGQMNTKEEKAVWEAFIVDFKHFLITGITETATLTSAVSESKRSRISYIGWVVLGALIGGLLSVVYNSLTPATPPTGILLIPVSASTFLSWRIRYQKANKAL